LATTKPHGHVEVRIVAFADDDAQLTVIARDIDYREVS
jgi:hypothetical protein